MYFSVRIVSFLLKKNTFALLNVSSTLRIKSIKSNVHLHYFFLFCVKMTDDDKNKLNYNLTQYTIYTINMNQHHQLKCIHFWIKHRTRCTYPQLPQRQTHRESTVFLCLRKLSSCRTLKEKQNPDLITAGFLLKSCCFSFPCPSSAVCRTLALHPKVHTVSVHRLLLPSTVTPRVHPKAPLWLMTVLKPSSFSSWLPGWIFFVSQQRQ